MHKIMLMVAMVTVFVLAFTVTSVNAKQRPSPRYGVGMQPVKEVKPPGWSHSRLPKHWAD
jgi:hypothetical protein